MAFTIGVLTSESTLKCCVLGIQMVWGVTQVKPIVPKPEGLVKVKMRQRDVAQAFVRTDHGVERWYLANDGDHWVLAVKIGENYRPGKRGCAWIPNEERKA